MSKTYAKRTENKTKTENSRAVMNFCFNIQHPRKSDGGTRRNGIHHAVLQLTFYVYRPYLNYTLTTLQAL